MPVKQYVFVEQLADRFGVDLDVIWQALNDLDLVEFNERNEPLPNRKAQQLGLWRGEWRELTGKWCTDLLPQLSMVLRMQISDDETTQANKLARRARTLAKEREQIKLREAEAERREQELCGMTGLQRVREMIAERTPILQAQYSEDQWQAELERQFYVASEMKSEHGFDDSYPDFESELWDRVIFTVDEMVHAAIVFEKSGRATPSPLTREQEKSVAA